MLSPPKVGKKTLTCTIIHANLDSQTPSVVLFSASSGLSSFFGVQVRRPLRSKRFRGQVSKEKDGRRITVEAEGRKKEGERAGSGWVGKQAALMYLIP